MQALPIASRQGRRQGGPLTPLQGIGVPLNNRFALAGDSRPGKDYVNSSAGAVYHGVEGIGWWIENLTVGAVKFDYADSFAVDGSTTEDFENNQVPSIIACDAANVLLLSSTNDQGAYGWSASRSIAALSAGINALLAAGKFVWVIAELPRGSTSYPSTAFTTQQQTDHDTVRAWILTLSHPRLKVIDAYPNVADSSGAGPAWIDEATVDGVHQSSNGAYLIASAGQSSIEAVFSADDFVYDSADTFDASTNPYGNLLVNSQMAGTGGGLTTGVTGQLANNWNAATNSFTGLSASLSKVTTATGDWQQITVTGDSGSGYPILQLNQSAVFSNLDIGDNIELRFSEWEVDANAVGFQAPEANLTTLLSGAEVETSRAGANADGPWPSDATSGRHRTGSNIHISGSENILQLALNLVMEANKTGVDFTVRFRNPVVRKVA